MAHVHKITRQSAGNDPSETPASRRGFHVYSVCGARCHALPATGTGIRRDNRLGHPTQCGPETDGPCVTHLATHPALDAPRGQAFRADLGAPDPRRAPWQPYQCVWHTNRHAALTLCAPIAIELYNRVTAISPRKDVLGACLHTCIAAGAGLHKGRLRQRPRGAGLADGRGRRFDTTPQKKPSPRVHGTHLPGVSVALPWALRRGSLPAFSMASTSVSASWSALPAS